MKMQATKRHITADRVTLTIEEVARALGIGRNSAFAAAHRGEIPVLKVGRRLLVPKAALEKMLAEISSGPDGKAKPSPIAERTK
jgi:excisionase family DNA binding protein